MSRPKSYTNDELTQTAEEIEGEYPNIAEAIRNIANNDVPEVERDPKELEDNERQLFQFVEEVNDLQTPEDYAYRIKHNQDHLSEEFPELTESETVHRLLDNLVREGYIGKAVSPARSDTRLYSTFEKVLRKVEVGGPDRADNPAFRWKPKFIDQASDMLEIDSAELTYRIHQHPMQGFHLPPIERNKY